MAGRSKLIITAPAAGSATVNLYWSDGTTVLTAYTTQTGSTTISQPATVSAGASTTFWVPDDEVAQVSATVSSIEVAGGDRVRWTGTVSNDGVRLTLGYPIGGGGGSGGAVDDLSDVTVTAAATGDILRYNGSAWVDYALTDVIVVAVGDETTAITTGTAKVTFRMPFAMTLTAVRASLTTASSSGVPTVDINEGGSTILSTKLTIDANEKTSTTAATPAVISDTALADDAEITIDIDVAGTSAAGLKVALIGLRA